MIVKSTKIWWNNYGLLVLLFITFTFFFMYWLMFTRTKDKGTYNRMSVPKYFNLLVIFFIHFCFRTMCEMTTFYYCSVKYQPEIRSTTFSKLI